MDGSRVAGRIVVKNVSSEHKQKQNLASITHKLLNFICYFSLILVFSFVKKNHNKALTAHS